MKHTYSRYFMVKIFPLHHHYHIRSGRNCFILFFFGGGGEGVEIFLVTQVVHYQTAYSLLSSGNEDEAITSEWSANSSLWKHLDRLSKNLESWKQHSAWIQIKVYLNIQYIIIKYLTIVFFSIFSFSFKML